jgi:tetratricopeptide (TPR) repeat protein/Txe/YoeB family toxin of Txe-Axe toxin-antitoxin module
MQSAAFDNVYVSPRVRVALHSILDTNHARKFWEIVNKLREGNFQTPGMRVERLHTRKGKVYSARLNIDMRVIFSMYADRACQKRSLVFWDANHHDDAYERIERTSIPEVFQPGSNFLEAEQMWSEKENNLAELTNEQPDEEEITNGLLLFRVPYYVLSEPNRYRSFEKNIDRYLRLSEEQEDLLGKSDKAYLIRGAAGTGKTSLALFYALNLHEQHPDDDVYFFTYHDELACVCRCYKANLVESDATSEQSGELNVFSYVQFCRHFLRKHPEVARHSWQWIDRATSIKHLKEIIGGRTRWARTVDPENFYGYIYSIFKGRLVPGTDRLPQTPDDFRRIFKGYGSVPENLEDMLEIFGHYEERLTRNKQKDEADLIRFCYQTFKDRAVLSAEDKLSWFVIDEIQDFTELEWKSVLLFWENQCLRGGSRIAYPFLCGDKNQNISRSGFRWQEVDSYVENVLRQIHRLSAVEKIQLHRNFRNTKQVFDLGVFVHSFAPQASGDMGLAPELEGKKPRLVLGDYEEFSRFLSLLNDPFDEKLPAPMVILFEDQQALNSVRNNIVNDDGLFLMPLSVSKGLEFEDLIIYRLFSSLPKTGEEIGEDAANRLFDLWYMAITRARQNLLIFLTPDDLKRLQDLFGSRYQQFLSLVDLTSGSAQSELLDFYHKRERYLPNYAVIFLERTKANETWQQYRDTIAEGNTQQAEELKRKAFKLWTRCRDVESLGRAHMELGEYSEALPYLKQASCFHEAAVCFEKLSRFEQAAEYYELDLQLMEAARCLERAKRYREAAELYDRQQEWLQAATNFYLAGNNAKAAECFEKAKMWQSAADLYKLRANWQKAAELYQKCQQYELAAEMYLKLKDKLDAARCFARAGLPEKAAPLYESLMRWGEAAECFEQSLNWDRAGQLYSKAGRLKDAARCKEQSGDLLSAAAAYERMKQWERAARAYLELKQPAKAAECFEQDDNWDEALPLWVRAANWPKVARCLENMGRLPEAAENYARAGLHNDAGHCYEKCERWADAADQYLKSDNYAAAASMLTRLGRRLDAGRLYLLSGQAKVAVEVVTSSAARLQASGENDLCTQLIEWIESTGKHDIAASLYEALNDWPRACEKYKQAMNLHKAAECSEKNRDFESAGDLYLQAGDFEKAAQAFKQAQQIKRAAQCYEMIKKWTEAKQLYEAIGDNDGIKRCETAANWL